MSQDLSGVAAGDSTVVTLTTADENERIYFHRSVGAVTVQFNDAVGAVAYSHATEGTDLGASGMDQALGDAVAYPLSRPSSTSQLPSLYIQTAQNAGTATLLLDKRPDVP